MKIIDDIKRTAKASDIWFFCILFFVALGFYFFSPGLEITHSEIIVCVVVLIAILMLLGIKIWTNIELHQFATIFLLVVGMLFAIIQPILNAPDETVHFARSEMVSRGQIIVDSNVTEYDIIQSVQELQLNKKKTYLGSDIRGKGIEYSMTKTGHVAASNATFLYFPQAIGVLIAKVLQLDVIWMLWLARIMNLICYALGVGLALKIAPKLKIWLFFISALPMSIQQAASCSPDAFVNMSAILLIAFFLYMFCTEQDVIKWKHVIIYMVLCILVTLSKMTNVFMAGLILLIPRSRFQSVRKATFSKVFVILCSIVCAVIYYWYITRFPSSQEHLIYMQEYNVNSGEQIKYIIMNFPEWLHNFGTSLVYDFAYYITSMSEFGWFQYSIPLISIVSIVLFVKMCIQEREIQINRTNKILVFLMVMGIYASTGLAMYLSWTPVGSSSIVGIQGRYFIPMLGLSVLLFMPTETVSVKKQRMENLVAIIAMDCMLLIATAVRYY